MIPASWRVETLTEGRIFFIEFYKRNRINFDYIEAIIEAIIYPWTGGYGQSAQKIFSLYATEIKTKACEMTVSERSVCLDLIIP